MRVGGGHVLKVFLFGHRHRGDAFFCSLATNIYQGTSCLDQSHPSFDHSPQITVYQAALDRPKAYSFASSRQRSISKQQRYLAYCINNYEQLAMVDESYRGLLLTKSERIIVVALSYIFVAPTIFNGGKRVFQYLQALIRDSREREAREKLLRELQVLRERQERLAREVQELTGDSPALAES
jgi:cell division protein FtsB